VRRLGSVSIVFAALLLLIEVPQIVTGAAFYMFGGGDAALLGIVGVAVIPLVVTLGLAAWLIASRDRLSSRWFDDGDAAVTIDPASLLRIAIIVTGVVTFGWGLSSLAVGAIGTVSRSMMGSVVGQNPELWMFDVPSIAGAVVSIVFGLALMFGSRSISGLLWNR
jgi:hypothetical protein